MTAILLSLALVALAVNGQPKPRHPWWRKEEDQQ